MKKYIFGIVSFLLVINSYAAIVHDKPVSAEGTDESKLSKVFAQKKAGVAYVGEVCTEIVGDESLYEKFLDAVAEYRKSGEHKKLLGNLSDEELVEKITKEITAKTIKEVTAKTIKEIAKRGELELPPTPQDETKEVLEDLVVDPEDFKDYASRVKGIGNSAGVYKIIF